MDLLLNESQFAYEGNVPNSKMYFFLIHVLKSPDHFSQTYIFPKLINRGDAVMHDILHKFNQCWTVVSNHKNSRNIPEV